MKKPIVDYQRKSQPIDIQMYKRYLPTAFDESLSLLEKVNKIIFKLNEIGELTNETIDMWNKIMEWIMSHGLDEIVTDKVIEKFNEMMDNGEFADLINDELLNEILGETKKIIEEFEFIYNETEPMFYTTVGNFRNAVNQSVNIDDETDRIYTTQARNDDGYIITESSPSGVLLSKMEIDGGGHSTLIGLDRKTNGYLKIWSLHEATNKIIQFEYKPDGHMTMDDAKNMTNFMPESLKNEKNKVHVTYDKYHDNLMFFYGHNIETRKRTDVREHNDKVLYHVDIEEQDYNTNKNHIRHMQGAITYGDTLYWLSGNSEQSSIPIIARYSMKQNKRLDDYKMDNIPGMYGKYNMQEDFSEPEGLAYYVNPLTGKHSLIFAITTGGHLKRYTNLYTLDQRNNEKHWQSLLNVDTQKYELTKADGRAWQIPDEMDDINYWLKPGIYYIRNEIYKEMKNTPYPDGGSNWWLMVYPMDQYFTRKEVLWRHSYGRRNIEFERSRNENKNKNGTWNIIHKSHMDNGENIQPDEWNNKLSNVDVPGDYYLSTSRSSGFDDFPKDYKGEAGWYLNVSEPSSGGSVLQTLTRNSNTYVDQFTRSTSKDSAGSWVKRGGAPWWKPMKLKSGVKEESGSGHKPQYGKVNDFVHLSGGFTLDSFAGKIITKLPKDHAPHHTTRLQFVTRQAEIVLATVYSSGEIEIKTTPNDTSAYVTMDGSNYAREGLY